MIKMIMIGLMGALALGCSSMLSPKAEDKIVQVSNRHYIYRFNCSNGLRLVGLTNRITNNKVTLGASGRDLALIQRGDSLLSLDAMHVEKVTREKGQIVFELNGDKLACRMVIRLDDSAESAWTLSVKNLGKEATPVKVTFPLLSGMAMGGDLAETRLYHGLEGGFFAREPIRIRAMSGYSFPVLDAYHPKKGGVYLVAHDSSMELKGFEAIKRQGVGEPRLIDNNYVRPVPSQVRADGAFASGEGCGLAITHRETMLGAGAEFTTSEVMVGIHAGRWEKAWESYRDWLNSVTQMRPLPEWYKRILISKPLFESQFHASEQYEFAKYIRPYDGPYSMFVMGNWTDTRGDYNVRPNWGGPEPFHLALSDLRDKGVRSCLYLEAVNVDPNAVIATQHSSDWTVLEGGIRAREREEGSNKEVFMCPGAPWKDYLAKTVSRVLSQTNCDVIYLDSVGMRFHMCEDTTHRHGMHEGWHRNVNELLRTVTQAVDKAKPMTPVFSENWSCDLSAMATGSSHSIGVQHAMQLIGEGYECDRTATNLFRFYFPDYKLIELEAKNEYGLGLAFFNGNAVHHHFQDEDLTPVMTEYVRVWGSNIEAFRSGHPEALLETGIDGVFMNRFPDGEKTIYTLWDSRGKDMNSIGLHEEMSDIALKPARGHHLVDPMRHQSIKACNGKAEYLLSQGKVGYIAELPRCLKAVQAKGMVFNVDYIGDLTSPSLTIYANPLANPSQKIVFEDEFNGTGKLNDSLWSGVEDTKQHYLTGNGTMRCDGGGTLWSNRGKGVVWDYSKTRTLEVRFRILKQPIPDGNFIFASGEEGTGPVAPRFELYKYNKTLRMGYSSMEGRDGFSSVPMEPYLKSPKGKEFNTLLLVMNREWRRAYINGRFYCEIPVQVTPDPATQWLIGLQGIEADAVRVYDGDASNGVPFFVEKTVVWPQRARKMSVDLKSLFGDIEIERLSFALMDGERLVDEVVIR